MKTKTEIEKKIRSLFLNPNTCDNLHEYLLEAIVDYAYNLQRNQRQTINDLHQAANVIASKYIAHPRVNTKISKFADNENPHYQTHVWDGAQHIMSELHSDPIRVLISFEHACEIRWGKKTFFSEINLDEEKMKKVHNELMEFINGMDKLIPKKFRTNKDTDFRTGLEL
jgi:hypothetical protein